MLLISLAILAITVGITALHISKRRAIERRLFNALLEEAERQGVPVIWTPWLKQFGALGWYQPGDKDRNGNEISTTCIFLATRSPLVLAHELGHHLAFPDRSEEAAARQADLLIRQLLRRDRQMSYLTTLTRRP